MPHCEKAAQDGRLEHNQVTSGLGVYWYRSLRGHLIFRLGPHSMVSLFSVDFDATVDVACFMHGVFEESEE